MQNKLRIEILKKILLTVNKNYNEDKIIEIINSPESINLIECIDYLVNKYSNTNEIYNSGDYKKLINIFKKTRVKEFPELEFYLNISNDLAEKFNLKVYRLFFNSHLFSDSKSLINMIAIMGLFENDSDVQNRINNIIKIFFYQRIYGVKEEYSKNPNIIKGKNTLYLLDENVWEFIPEELKPYFFEDVTPEFYSFLKNMKGNFGRKLNDFLTPFNQNRELKNGIKTNHLYMEYLIKEKKDYDYHPFAKNIDDYYIVNPNLSLDDIKKTLKVFKEYELTYGPSDIKSMFKNCNPFYDPEFYEYFIKHQPDIINSRNSFSKFPFIQEKFHEIINYYKEHGNNNPDYITMIEFLRTLPYEVEFGDEEFAQEARNAGVLKESYSYYADLLKKVRKRYIRTIPNHRKYYNIVGKDGNTYTIETKILDGTDYLNLLIGESKYTDCCQKSDDLGRECLEHASISPNGGIFLVSLVTDTGIYPISQSWIWKNEQELVLDNVEQTLFLKISTSKTKEIYEDIIAEAIKKAGTDILENANQELEKYIYLELQKENNSKWKLERLRESLLRQTIKVITLGSGYSDILVSDYFKQQAKRNLILPKDYNQKGYTDATVRYIVAGSEESVTVEPNINYVEEPIYRIPRKINECLVFESSTSAIKKIIEIDNNLSIKNIEEFYKIYRLNKNDKLLYGEDWYIIYHEDNGIFTIVKYNMGLPRLEDEKNEQYKELNENIATLINYNKETGKRRVKKNEKNNTII